MRWMTWQAITATSQGAVQLNRRGFKVRWMTWRATLSRPYKKADPRPWRKPPRGFDKLIGQREANGPVALPVKPDAWARANRPLVTEVG